MHYKKRLHFLCPFCLSLCIAHIQYYYYVLHHSLHRYCYRIDIICTVWIALDHSTVSKFIAWHEYSLMR